MDIVYIRDLRIDTIIGIYDWERQVRQTVSIDLEMATDIRRAAATDDIQYALNYKAVSKRLIAYVENRNALLVETLAEEIATVIREEFNVPWLRLRLSKPGAIRGARDVGLVIERGEKPLTERQE
jgi:dihydroneopterin aldolase